jgi:predicted AlkP superfamily phosphohydrolase/phosphomutase
VLALIALDAVSLPLLTRLLEEGRLPRIAELRASGEWLDLDTPATHFATATYHVLHTGKHVGEHGLYYPYQWSPEEQRVQLLAELPQPETVWERVSRAGGRSLVIDPYEAQPPRTMAGDCVSGLQFTNRVALQRWSVPDEAQRRLSRVLGRPPAVEEVFGSVSARELLRAYRALVAAPARVAAAMRELHAARGSYDLVWIDFAATHVAGHQLWDLSQIDARLDPDDRRTLENGLAAVYEATDAALGQVVSLLPPESELIVFSPVGMGVNTSRADLLPGMLERIVGEDRDGDSGGAGSSIWRLRASVPTPVRAAIARAVPDRVALELTARLSLYGTDWSRTKAFSLPSDHHAHVRLNIKGRERDGIIEPEDADAVMDEIRDGLLSFRDPDGSPSVAGVERVSELARGEGAHRLPDLIVRWGERPATRLTGVSSERFGRVGRRGALGRSGSHRPEAWALAVPSRTRLRTNGTPAVVDLPATACALLGADMTGLAGTPLLELK